MKILGNQNKIELIKKLITKNQFPNSLILIGQKAIGKSLIAKNIALCLTNSINLKELNNITNKSNQNILYVSKEYLEEKKQNKKLMYRDDIAYINEFFKTKNENNSKKVCVIDSIDDLSIDAINSLLKIIEEPKINNHFVLISHNNKKLLPTIISRSFTIKLNNFEKNDYMSIMSEIDDLKTADHSYLYDLTRGSIDISRNYLKYNFRDVDNHLEKIFENKENIKANTVYHYIKFLNDRGIEKDLIVSFFDYLILKNSFFIKNKFNVLKSVKINHFINVIDELRKLKERYITFNLSHEHILIHYFNRLKQQ